MSDLFLKAYLHLVRFEFYLARRDFAGLYHKVRTQPLVPDSRTSDAIGAVCSAIDLACIWYWKEVLCLQRSAATACLLKRSGVPAHLVIGAQQLPFKAHAWVEVDGCVINDKPYVQDTYLTLDRC